MRLRPTCLPSGCAIPTRALSIFYGLLLAFAACGGKVVVDDGGSQGQGGTGTTSSSGSGPGLCTKHLDCPTAQLCVFATGTCAPACDNELCSSCTAGTFCDPCATSACPECLDCRGACLPTPPGQCDENDPCLSGEVCLYSSGVCAPGCSSDADCGGFASCADCVTGSCCGCEDCVSACVGGE